MRFKLPTTAPVIHQVPLLLGVFYLLGLVYFGLHPFNYARVYWNHLVAGLPELPLWLLQASPDHLVLSVLLGIPLGFLFAAGLVGGRMLWQRAAESALLWLLLSLAGVGIVLLQLFFPLSVIPRLQVFALSAGIAAGVLAWAATGKGIRTTLGGLDPLRLTRRFGGVSGVWQLALAGSVWTGWLAAGSWGLDAGSSPRDWLAASWFWAWPMGILGLLWALALCNRAAIGTRRWRRLFGLWLSLSALGLLLEGLHLARAHGVPMWQHILVAQQSGIVSGIALGWAGYFAVGDRWVRGFPGVGMSALGWPLVPVLVALLVLLPASGDQPLSSVLSGTPPYSVAGSLQASGQNLYQAIKIAMLWMPLALMFAFVARGNLLLGWAVASITGFLLVCLPWVPDWPARLWFEQGATVMGIVTGLWLADQLPRSAASAQAPAAGPLERGARADVSTEVPAVLTAGAEGVTPAAVTGGIPAAGNVRARWRARGAESAAAARPGAAFRARTPFDRGPQMAPAPGLGDGDRERVVTAGVKGKTAGSTFRSRGIGSGPTPQAVAAELGAAVTGSNTGADRLSPRRGDGLDLQPPPAVSYTQRIGRWLQRGLGIAVLAAVFVAVIDFPRWPLAIGIGLACYLLLLSRYPLAAVGVIPALLPVLDLAPWTGRFYLDEFDLLLLVTLAMLLWHGWLGRSGLPLGKPVAVALSLVVLSWTIALGIGVSPLVALDGNAFSNYWSHYNALRVYKGILEALLLLLLLSRGLALDRSALERWLLPGLWLGLAMVVVVGVREHWLFAGPFALDAPYRITAGFSSMHTGGGHIEAYLVLAIPFLWLWPRRSHQPLWLALGAAVLLAATYVTLVTVSRGGVAGLALGFAVLALGALRSRHDRGHGQLVALSVAIMVIVALLAVAFGFSGGGYLSERMSQVERDFHTRWNHWSNALEMRPDGIGTRLFGAGLGRFPDTYLHSARARTEPTLHRFEREQGRGYLRLNAGETLYLAQRVQSSPATAYRLEVTARGFDYGDKLDVPLCEKQLLDSHECRWNSFDLTSPGDWQYFERRLNSGPVGAGPWWWSRPVELSLFNPRKGAVVDVLEVAMYGPDGENLLANGDFSASGDYWFFKTHDHLPWHLKNLWVALLFEQGWYGVVAFCLLLVLVLVPLGRRMWSGDLLAAVLLAAILGFLVVGLVGSLFDAPRLTLLFFMLLMLAGLSNYSSGRH